MRIGFTALIALVSVFLAGCTPTPQLAKGVITIHTIGPLGQSFYKPPQPIWRFAITNAGTSAVCWMTGIELTSGRDGNYGNAGGHIDWPCGILTPGQSLQTNMIVPAKTGSVWRAYVQYWTLSPEELKSSQAKAEQFGVEAFEFCPFNKERSGKHSDKWHQVRGSND